ncbi:unnamed protein product [Plutella xylostella]|uniref:(diamondback moth) hypothetical protein n=1 Tax=Plutella xylostella TaxID=51655 RepID=A0A8S4F1S7_PLUXY|nr:unnamed protein product [Plutella xylostella]
MFVTGLQFVPARGSGPPVASRSEAALLSISVDNRLCVHSLDYRSIVFYSLGKTSESREYTTIECVVKTI